MATKRLPPMASLGDILRMYNIRAKKNLSQNFIMDPRLLHRIASTAGPLEGKFVVEVGPGPGGITRAILGQGAARCAVIEKDPRFLPSLNQLKEASGNRMDIYMGDVLHFNMERIFPEELRRDWTEEPDIRIVANLPFNVSTPLIIKWIRAMSERSSIFAYGRVQLTLTFQHEVAYRMVAPPNNKQRSRLSVICQNWAHVNYDFMMPGGAFVPPPDVEVGLVTLRPLVKPYIDLPFPLVNHVVTTLFRGKQKYLYNTIKQLFPPTLDRPLTDQMLKLANINPQMLPIQLGMSEVDKLCHAYKFLCELNPSVERYRQRNSSAAALSSAACREMEILPGNSVCAVEGREKEEL